MKLIFNLAIVFIVWTVANTQLDRLKKNIKTDSKLDVNKERRIISVIDFFQSLLGFLLIPMGWFGLSISVFSRVNARNLDVNGDTLKAVYLDLKDRNRSLTSLQISADGREKISNDLKRVISYIGRRNHDLFSYVDFIRIIAISHPQFYFHPQFDFEITTSRAYNSLLKKQKVFSDRDQVKRNYETEQVHTLHQIERIL